MKVSFIVPCRNKGRHVGATVDSVFRQTFSPMEIVLSDQGSTDGSLAVLEDKASLYDGPNKVWIFRCPDLEYRGMAGLNCHLNWLHTQIDGDVVIMCSADDLVHADRATRTVQMFREHGASYVGTGLRNLWPDGSLSHDTDFPDRRSRWIKPLEVFPQTLTISMSSAWARDLYEKHGPLRGVEAQDIILPVMALYERGVYYLDELLHYYIRWGNLDSPNQAVSLVAQQDAQSPEMAQAFETNAWQNASHWHAVARRFHEDGVFAMMSVPEQGALFQRILAQTEVWARARDYMTVKRIEPKNMAV
jgi:glycosyltransferase involved in cell wall biosynthesis